MYSIIIIHVMSYSCERTRTKAYNDDVRWRIVWQAMGLNFSVSKIAANLCVDESTVHRIINKFQETGEVQKKIYPLDKAYRKLTEPAQLFILQRTSSLYAFVLVRSQEYDITCIIIILYTIAIASHPGHSYPTHALPRVSLRMRVQRSTVFG